MDRIERINETIKREISLIIQQDLSDPRLALVMINRAQVSRDLQHAKIYFSALGDESRAIHAQQGLDSAKGLIRKMVGQRLRLKFLPDLIFVHDKSVEYVNHLREEMERFHGASREDPRPDQEES